MFLLITNFLRGEVVNQTAHLVVSHSGAEMQSLRLAHWEDKHLQGPVT